MRQETHERRQYNHEEEQHQHRQICNNSNALSFTYFLKPHIQYGARINCYLHVYRNINVSHNIQPFSVLLYTRTITPLRPPSLSAGSPSSVHNELQASRCNREASKSHPTDLRERICPILSSESKWKISCYPMIPFSRKSYC